MRDDTLDKLQFVTYKLHLVFVSSFLPPFVQKLDVKEYLFPTLKQILAIWFLETNFLGRPRNFKIAPDVFS